VIDNNQIFFGNSGTVEFWVNPKFDSRNDSLYRYLFDTSSATIEETTSITKGTIKLSSPAKRVYSIQLLNEKSVLATNYAIGGSLAADMKTYTVGQPLPYQQTPVKVVYSLLKEAGNRFSIYKDSRSVLCFEVQADKKTYIIKTPIFWSRNTWHRIMATWDFTKPRLGEMHLFVDGEEKKFAVSGTFIAGTGYVSGTIVPGGTLGLNLSIKDQFQTLYIGGNFLGGNVMSCKIDNLKISNHKKDPIYISGQAFDNDYNSNIEAVLPVVEDLYTTYLSNFDKNISKIDDFAILKDKVSGIFDFTMEIFDNFEIIDDNARVKEILETLIKLLKPANSRAFIKYVK
jgi:hypothetical protein